MNRDIVRYVLSLGDRITRRQHHVLLVLACHHQEARETFWPTRVRLAAELTMDQSQLRRIIGELEQLGILRHIPGVGAGNRSSFVFSEFEKGDVKGDKKGDFFDPVIRNYKTFTNPNPPNPPSGDRPQLAQRDLRAVRSEIERIEKANVGRELTFQQVFEQACLNKNIHPDDARDAMGIEVDGTWRRQPQRVGA